MIYAASEYSFNDIYCYDTIFSVHTPICKAKHIEDNIVKMARGIERRIYRYVIYTIHMSVCVWARARACV